MTTSLAILGGSTLAADANVSDELARAGMGLGNLVLQIGKAVASTQNQLNETSAATASSLATTLVDMIAVEEKVYRDDGTLDHVTSHVRQLPLINFMDPPFYEWSTVRVQGQYFANEFAASSESDQFVHSSSEGYGQGGLLVVLGGGFNEQRFHGDSITTTGEQTDDVSVGMMRMNTMLRPRQDVSVPKPRQVVQGPRLSIIQGEIVDVSEEGALAARTMSLLVQYHRRDGSPITGKAISIETDGLPWSFTGEHTTNATGQLEIQLRREFIDADASTTPIEVVVSARIGIVSNSVTVTF